ncbi:hypothetical protein [Pseudovibrio sp. POLY-S9]|uniref:hypothetical protein n=1 Tax=Pseudovibrio sp. POLY-S9 TaxID=1576596 RepID=UPI00070F9F7A|nr:hypothetical protein [Pseudovibrio sp. POLY-S9]
MIYSPTIRAKIMERRKRRMSPRGIANIYGCSIADVENVIETEKAERIVLSGVPVVGGKALHPVQSPVDTPEGQPLKLFEKLPEDLKEYAVEVARMLDAPVLRLFTYNSKSERDFFCRGFFYHGLKCKFNLSYDAIGALVGSGGPSVTRAVYRYCKKVGLPTPGKVVTARRAVA